MTDAAADPRISVIGLGAMGSALADTLIAKGFHVTVWNRTPAKAQRFAEAGVPVASSMAEAARGSDVLVVNLFDQAAVKDAVLTEDVGSALRGKTLVELTTYMDGLPALEAWCAHYQVALLKGDILAYPDAVRVGTASVCYSGTDGDFAATLPILKALGGQPIHAAMGTRAQQAIVSAYYCFLYPALLGLVVGAAKLHRAGVAVGPLADGLILRGAKDAPWYDILANTTNAIAKRRYDENIQAALDTWNDGLAGAIASSEMEGSDTTLQRAVKTMLDRAVAAGHGQHDIAAVFETLIAERRR